MARNAEKAMTALARWRRMKIEEEKGPEIRRPGRAQDCTDLKQAEKWRREILRDIAKRITQIQNPGLGEFKIRDVNDEINKLLRLKFHWEIRVKELGGPDYKRIAPRMLDREGRDVPGNRTGYKYFGAAKDLPGVRELFEKAIPEPGRKNRGDLMRDVDADYYGYMDDDDGVLIPLEQEEEEKAIAKKLEEWKEKKEKEGGEITETSRKRQEEQEPDIYHMEDDNEDEGEIVGLKRVELDEHGQPKYISHVPVPTQQDIEEALLRRKKMELLDKYASESLIQQSETARTLLGFETDTSQEPQPKKPRLEEQVQDSEENTSMEQENTN